jgi:hypothetical protein
VAFVEWGHQGVGVRSCFSRGVDNVDCALPAVEIKNYYWLTG